MRKYKTICEQAARAAGHVLRHWQGNLKVREKGPADLVTQADLASQDVLHEILLGAFPDHGFLGEEDTQSRGAATGSDQADSHRPEYRWIVDPLDGTTNYVHGLDQYCVSIALQRGRDVILGAVFDPVRDEYFSACAGEGAFLNGSRLSTSDVTELNQALVAASFSQAVQPGSPEVSRFLAVLYRCQALRRMGSAALNMCYVASGRLDAYWASSVKAWDIAAGALLIAESGGIVTALEGGPFCLEEPAFTAAACPALHRQLLQTMFEGQDLSLMPDDQASSHEPR